MNENDKNLGQEPEQETTEHRSNTLEGERETVQNPASQQQGEEEKKTVAPMIEETGMDKPKDFSPIPPQRVVDKKYSVMPPPVFVDDEFIREPMEDESREQEQERPEETIPPLEERKVDTIVLEEPMVSNPIPTKPQEETGVQAPHPEDEGMYHHYSQEKQSAPPESSGVEGSFFYEPEEPVTPLPPVTPVPPLSPPVGENEQAQPTQGQGSPLYLEWLALSQAQQQRPQAPPQQQRQQVPPPQTGQSPTGQSPTGQVPPPPPQGQWRRPEPWEQQQEQQQAYPDYSQYNHQQNQGRGYQWDYASYENYYQQPQKKKNRGVAVFITMLVMTLVIGVVGLGVAGYISERNQQRYFALPDGETPPAASQQEVPTGDPDSTLTLHMTETPDRSQEPLPPAGELLTVPQVAKKVIPSVVGVMKYSERNLYQATGLGSGIILSLNEEGDVFVISNAHVVEQGTNFMVQMSDGSKFDAILVGEDLRSDLAVLKITAAELGDYVPIPAEIGTSKNTLVGEIVVAIGNPVNFELSGSVTQGIVSAVDREIKTEIGTMNYIQTDAAINPGNSGGALVNAYGQVIGINTMKVNAVGFEGIGFAIPMADALPVLEELVNFGTVTNRAMLGITAFSVPETQEGNVIIPAGIMVQEVSPFAKFSPEIRQYDIITHCNGTRVFASGDLHQITDEYKAGDTIELTVYRKTSTVATETVIIKVELISSGDFG